MLKINRARACTLLLYTETVGRMKGSLPLFIKMCFTLLQTNWLTRRKSTSLLPTSSTVPSANCLATKTIVAGVGFTKPLRSASPPPGGDKQALLTNVQLYLYELAMIFCWFIILFEFSLSLLCLNFFFYYYCSRIFTVNYLSFYRLFMCLIPKDYYERVYISMVTSYILEIVWLCDIITLGRLKKRDIDKYMIW